jgi:hypothetical protein
LVTLPPAPRSRNACPLRNLLLRRSMWITRKGLALMLSVHPSRISGLLTKDRMRLDPPIRANTYHDSFGNFCHVIRAPTGRLTISADFLGAGSSSPPLIENGEVKCVSP